MIGGDTVPFWQFAVSCIGLSMWAFYCGYKAGRRSGGGSK